MSKLKTVAIIQARMQSERLPGKVMKKVLKKPLLGYMLERIQACQFLDEIVVATSTLSVDDLIADYCEKKGVACFRGSEQDVLDRYYHAALEYEADIIVRLTADCPIHDPDIIDSVVQILQVGFPDIQYISNTGIRSFPRGMDVEAFSMEWLSIAQKNAKLPLQREHVTPYIYSSIDRTKVANYMSAGENRAYMRLVVDESQDFELIRNIIEALYPSTPEFGIDNILELLDENPEWLKINADVKQK